MNRETPIRGTKENGEWPYQSVKLPDVSGKLGECLKFFNAGLDEALKAGGHCNSETKEG
jgi:hypothetical protein